MNECPAIRINKIFIYFHIMVPSIPMDICIVDAANGYIDPSSNKNIGSFTTYIISVTVRACAHGLERWRGGEDAKAI